MACGGECERESKGGGQIRFPPNFALQLFFPGQEAWYLLSCLSSTVAGTVRIRAEKLWMGAEQSRAESEAVQRGCGSRGQSSLFVARVGFMVTYCPFPLVPGRRRRRQNPSAPADFSFHHHVSSGGPDSMRSGRTRGWRESVAQTKSEGGAALRGRQRGRGLVRCGDVMASSWRNDGGEGRRHVMGSHRLKTLPGLQRARFWQVASGASSGSRETAAR